MAIVNFSNGDTGSAIRTKLNQALTDHIEHNMAATSAPTAGDDTGDGYQVGSYWLWAAKGLLWQCADATASAARWELSLGPKYNPLTGPRSVSYLLDLHEPFASTNGSYCGGIWQNSFTGTGAAIAAVSPTTEPTLCQVGGRRLDVGTTSTGQVGYSSQTNGLIFGTADHKFAIRCTLPSVVVSGTETYEWWAGWSAGTPVQLPAAQSDCAALVYRWSGSAPELTFKTRNNTGTVESTTVGSIPAVATMFVVEITVPVTGNVTCLIDGTQVATHSTKPRLTGLGYRNMVSMLKSAGTTSRTFDVDWMYYEMMGIRA